MEKRAYERISASIKIGFRCNGTSYNGTITNLSEKGVFISTDEICSSYDAQLELYIPWNDGSLTVSANLIRIILSHESDGMGVELVNPPGDYSDLLSSIKAAV